MSDAVHTAHEESFEFQAEIRELLHLLIHSLYTKKEIFVRELVSNASDALDKMRYIQLAHPETGGGEIPLEIRIEVDETAKTLAISDTGIGMTRAEIVQNLGTIAKSGSMEFIKKLAEDKRGDMNLIGQFGVGFYSAFMAASEVRVITKSYRDDEPGQIWISGGSGSYTIREIPVEKRGTRIEVQLKDDASEFLSAVRLENIIKKYSNFVPYPVFVAGKQANSVSAIWTKPKNDITDEEYDEFYKFLSGSPDGPATRLHLVSDAPLSFQSVLFVPKTNFEKMGMGKLEHGPDLYARKVLIQHNCKELVPDYLRFVRGVVDSEDITLNVSRETIQDNAVLRKISRNLVKKLLDHLASMLAGRREDYLKFYGEFGRILKEGVAIDYENRQRLGKLFLYPTSAGADDAPVTLKEYSERMKEGQKAIYYLAAPDRRALDASPHLEMFRKRGIEIVYLYDPVDDFVLSGLGEFNGKPLKSADQVEPDELKDIAMPEGAEKTEGKKEDTIAFSSAFDAFLKRFREILGDRVEDVKESARLSSSPCLLVTPGSGPSIQAQKVISMIDRDFRMAKRVLEVNKDNPLVRNLVAMHGEQPESPLVSACCEQLFENAMLMEGILPDPSGMVPRIQRIMEEAASGKANRT
ncbi:MAG: molecular chaperone HtpG [Nitrospirae bacterium]|nr:molecular chaperone HtpG [Nitrospirota bacterium]